MRGMNLAQCLKSVTRDKCINWNLDWPIRIKYSSAPCNNTFPLHCMPLFVFCLWSPFLCACWKVMTSHCQLAWCMDESLTWALTFMCELKQTSLSMFGGKLTGFERLYPRVPARCTVFESDHSHLFAFTLIIHGQAQLPKVHTLTLRPLQPFPVFRLYITHYQLHSTQIYEEALMDRQTVDNAESMRPDCDDGRSVSNP